MQPKDNVGFLLLHLAFTMARQNDQILQERLGIGFSQFKILKVLSHNPRIQQRTIADNLGQTEASISRQIKLMLDKGLLQSTVSPENRRMHVTTLTSKGTRLIDEAIVVLGSFQEPMLETLTEKQRTQLQEILNSLHEYICQNGKTGACHQTPNK